MATKINLDPFIPLAQEQERKYGIPASITLGQIILESSGSYANGLSGLANKANNLFGIKAGSSWNGDVYRATTTEEIDGKNVLQVAEFRKYDSFAESIDDHSKLLSTSRYAQFTNQAKSIEDYAKGIKAGGYATDSLYVDKLMGVISSNNLTLYDSGAWQDNPNKYDPEDIKDSVTTQNSIVNMSFAQNLVAVTLTVIVLIIGIVFFVNGLNVQIPNNLLKG